VITVAQLRAARALIGWSQPELAEHSGVGIATIRRMEGARGLPKTTAENVWKVQRALEDAGIIFINDNDEGPGVRLRKSRDD
jgi:transcriptional regulator with XRE-family HTH domain